MATLAVDKSREYGHIGPESTNRLPVVAADIIYQGAACGHTAGTARPLVAGDAFVGFNAFNQVDNAAGAASDKDVELLTRGILRRITITGATTIADINKQVFATDDDTFAIGVGMPSLIGRIIKFNTDDSTFDIYFEAATHRALTSA